MHTFIMQDYTTFRGSNNTIVQNESGWLDLTPYQDLVFWIDCREATGTVTLTLQTSPTKDDAMFAAIITAFALTANSVIQKPALLGVANVPIARFARFTLNSSAAPWDATLRIYVAANSPGM